MSDVLARNRERVSQSRAARRKAIDASPATLPTSATRSGAPYLPGERVFDSVSGLDGEVTGCSRANIPNMPSIAITLEDGRHVVRRPEELIGTPTPAVSER